MPAPITQHPAPIVRIYCLIVRMGASSANVFRHATTLLLGWCVEEADFRNTAAQSASAIDDPIESKRAMIEECLRNDPPHLRRAVLAALDEAHARTEAQAAALRVQLPLTGMEREPRHSRCGRWPRH